jgi:membrane fusion protein (multidrug efflux system)
MKKLFSILIITSVLSACSSGNSSDKKSELDKLVKEQSDINDKIKKLREEIGVNDSTEKATLVQVTPLAPQPFNHYIEVQAMVEGDEDVQVSPETMGNVTSIPVKAGDNVSKGQVLAVLDDKLMQQSVAELQSQLDLATSLYNKQKSLWDQKIGSEVQFMQAKTNKESLEKRMAALHEQWEMTRIKSPINGTVDNVEIKVGQSVAPGMPAIHVVNLSALKVKAEVAESFINKVQKGNDALIYFPDLDKEIKTKITYSGNSISSLNRTFNVEVHLDPKDGTFHPNMIAVLKIIDYHTPAAITVPVKTIQSGTDGNYVFVAANQNGKPVSKRQKVVPGVSYNGVSEIKEGLKPGDKLITLGYADLVEGQQIKF